MSRRHERPGPGIAHPGDPEVIPHHHPLPTVRIAARLGRMVVNDHVGDVAELPAGSEQVQGEKLLFAADEEALLETADLKKRGPTHHYGASEKPEQRRPGQRSINP